MSTSVSSGRTTADHAATSSRTVDNPIAIVGLGALFPGASSAAQFWDNIVAGRDCITDVPETHWRKEDYFSPDPRARDKTYSHRGGFIPDVPFSPIEFGMPPATLEVTDVLQLLSLGVARDTLADAGAPGSSWYSPERTGVILGITGANSILQPLISRLQTPVLKEVVRSIGLSDEDADEVAERFVAKFAPWEENSFPGMLGNVVAGRIANRFDFGGTNCTVDAACASSLAALQMAIGELNSGRADMMITGGCDAENTILMFMCFSKTPALSKSGRIRPFDENADGTLIGEGTGMIAIKRLADAERDGDRIYSVIRGIGSSSDGRYKSIYAPRASGQVQALRRAYADAGLVPGDIGLLECHGTGTKVGDRTELTALEEAFDSSRNAIAVGSVKSQIGHTKAAAGAASLIKTAYALHNRVLPPTINVDTVRTDVNFVDGPFYVNTVSRPWFAGPGEARRAGISGFGFGGTNFHVVLEEHRASQNADVAADPAADLQVWHAPTPAELLDVVDQAPSTLEAPIPSTHARLAVAAAATDIDAIRAETVSRLRADGGRTPFTVRNTAWYAPSASLVGKVAGLFAGQGSQYVNMGRTAVMDFPAIQDSMESVVRGYGDPSLAEIIYPQPSLTEEGKRAQQAVLTETRNAQRAIGALSVAQFDYLDSLGLRLDGALGHSFGEVSALYATGALSRDHFATVAAARGAAMSPLPGSTDAGSMAALSADIDTVRTLLGSDGDVVISNYNGPQQVVVGGSTAGIERTIATATAAGVTATRLPVAAAFHTRFVAHARDQFARAIDTVQIRAPRQPVYPTASDRAYGTDMAANAAVLADQLIAPVEFYPQIEAMYRDGFRTFIEFGPGRVLTGLAQKTFAGRDDVVAVSVDGGAKADSALSMQKALAQLLVLGVRLTNPRARAWIPAAPERPGTIAINGVNIVPERREKAFRERLENGYRVGAATDATTTTTIPEDAIVPAARAGTSTDRDDAAVAFEPAPTGVAGTDPSRSTPQQEIIAMSDTTVFPAVSGLVSHDRYLEAQIAIGHRLVDLLERAAANGHVDSNLVDALQAISTHTSALGHAHAQATGAVRGLVGDGVETPQAAVPAPVTAAVPAVVERVSHSAPETPVVVARFDSPSVAAPVPATPPAAASVPAAPATVAAPAAAAVVVADPQVRTAVLETVAAKTGYSEDMLDESMSVEADLGIDSIKRVEIMGELRERFPQGGDIATEQMAEIDTLGDIINLLSGQAAADAMVGGGVYPKASELSGIHILRARHTEVPAVIVADHPYGTAPSALVASAGPSERAAEIAAALAARGFAVSQRHSITAVDAAESPVADLTVIVTDGESSGPAGFMRSVASLTDAVLLAGECAAPVLHTDPPTCRRGVVFVTAIDGRHGHGPSTGTPDLAGAVVGGVTGIAKTLKIERPGLFVRAIDLAPAIPADVVADVVVAEAHDINTHTIEIAYRGANARDTIDYLPVTAEV